MCDFCLVRTVGAALGAGGGGGGGAGGLGGVNPEQDLLDLPEVDLLHRPIQTEDCQEGMVLCLLLEVGFVVEI
jgi:hypothetical protein